MADRMKDKVKEKRFMLINLMNGKSGVLQCKDYFKMD